MSFAEGHTAHDSSGDLDCAAAAQMLAALKSGLPAFQPDHSPSVCPKGLLLFQHQLGDLKTYQRPIAQLKAFATRDEQNTTCALDERSGAELVLRIIKSTEQRARRERRFAFPTRTGSSSRASSGNAVPAKHPKLSPLPRTQPQRRHAWRRHRCRAICLTGHEDPSRGMSLHPYSRTVRCEATKSTLPTTSALQFRQFD